MNQLGIGMLFTANILFIGFTGLVVIIITTLTGLRRVELSNTGMVFSDFQESATALMENIIDLNLYVFFFR